MSSLDKFDFIQLKIYDVHGNPKGRTVARNRMDEIIKKGVGIYGGICYFGVMDQPNCNAEFGEKSNYGNIYLKPIMETLMPCQKSARGQHRVGQVLCELVDVDGKVDPSLPRTCAQLQLDKLQKELGLTICSAFEMDFNIMHKETGKVFGHDSQWAQMTVLDNCHEILLDMIQELKEVDIAIDCIQTECGPGQFEITQDVSPGLKMPDRTAQFRSGAKTFLQSRGYKASFMSSMKSKTECANGFHFNHSLWSSYETQNKHNAFVDTSQPHKLSELGRHWLAGLIEHAPAMTALCCPTVNCYRRIGGAWAPVSPKYCNWGEHNRMCSFRLKVEGENVYIENRLPTSACNPFLVMACNVAAGMDGVRRKLPLPKASDDSRPLPKDLNSALTALENDLLLVEALGPKMVEHFTYNKRIFEIQEFKNFDSGRDEEKMDKEMEVYFNNI